MSLSHISDEFEQFLNRHRFQKQFSATQVVIFANQIAQGRFQATSFKGEILTVKIKDQTDRYLLSSQIDQIIHDINQLIGSKKIKKIKFKI